MRLLSIKQFNATELFIRHTHNSNFTKFRKKRFYSLNMHLCILHACTMPDIKRKLKHRETIPLQIFTKINISFLVFFGICR